MNPVNVMIQRTYRHLFFAFDPGAADFADVMEELAMLLDAVAAAEDAEQEFVEQLVDSPR